jgi:hypothetical protein
LLRGNHEIIFAAAIAKQLKKLSLHLTKYFLENIFTSVTRKYIYFILYIDYFHLSHPFELQVFKLDLSKQRNKNKA